MLNFRTCPRPCLQPVLVEKRPRCSPVHYILRYEKVLSPIVILPMKKAEAFILICMRRSLHQFRGINYNGWYLATIISNRNIVYRKLWKNHQVPSKGEFPGTNTVFESRES